MPNILSNWWENFCDAFMTHWHSYAVNRMLDHGMFNKLQMTMFCLSKRCPPFTRLQILKATLAHPMPYKLSLHVKIHSIKQFQENSTWRSWKMVKVHVSCLYFGCHDYLLTCWLGFCGAQIHFIFALPQNTIMDLPPDVNPPTHLTYVELFPALHTSSWCRPWHIQDLMISQPSWWMLSPYLTSWWDTSECPSIFEVWTSSSSWLDQ